MALCDEATLVSEDRLYYEMLPVSAIVRRGDVDRYVRSVPNLRLHTGRGIVIVHKIDVANDVKFCWENAVDLRH